MGHHRPARPHPRTRLHAAARLQEARRLAGRDRRRRDRARRHPGEPAQAPVQKEEALHRGRRGAQGLEDGRAAVPGLRAHREASQGEGHHPLPEEPRQEGRLGHHRDRLRPRGRAHRIRRAFVHPGGQPRRAGEPRALLRLHEGRDHACVRQPGRRRLRSGERRRVASGHRPDLGRGAHALPDAREVRRLRQRAQLRPRADAHPRAHRGARARAPRVRARGLLGDPRPLRRGRYRRSDRRRGRARLRGAACHGALQGGGGRQDGDGPHRGRDVGPRVRRREEAPPRGAACAVQYDEPDGGRIGGGPLPGAHDAHRREPVHGWLHQLSARRQHGVSQHARPARDRAGHRRQPRLRAVLQKAAGKGQAHGDPRQEGSTTTIRRSTPRRLRRPTTWRRPTGSSTT